MCQGFEKVRVRGCAASPNGSSPVPVCTTTSPPLPTRTTIERSPDRCIGPACTVPSTSLRPSTTTRIQTGRITRSSIVTPRAAGLTGADCGAAGRGDTAAFRAVATLSLTTVGGDARLPRRVDTSATAVTAMMTRMPADRTPRRYRCGTGEAGRAVLSATESVSEGATTVDGDGSGNGSGEWVERLGDSDVACCRASDAREVAVAPSDIGVDAGARKPLMNAANSSEVRCRACRAARIDSRNRSSSASAASSSNGWACSFDDTVPSLSQPLRRVPIANFWATGFHDRTRVSLLTRTARSEDLKRRDFERRICGRPARRCLLSSVRRVHA